MAAALDQTFLVLAFRETGGRRLALRGLSCALLLSVVNKYYRRELVSIAVARFKSQVLAVLEM
jgi:hypothetical protein